MGDRPENGTLFTCRIRIIAGLVARNAAAPHRYEPGICRITHMTSSERNESSRALPPRRGQLWGRLPRTFCSISAARGVRHAAGASASSRAPREFFVFKITGKLIYFGAGKGERDRYIRLIAGANLPLLRFIFCNAYEHK